MEKPLNGIFRVSFDIEVDASDQVSLSDVAQSLSEGLGEGLLERVSNLSVEKIEKHGKQEPKILKVGDMVKVKDTIKIKAHIYCDDGYFFVGTPSDISEINTTEPASLDIEAGSIGYINKIMDGKVEVIDLDNPITKYAEIGIDAVNIDLITIDTNLIEKIDLDGGK